MADYNARLGYALGRLLVLVGLFGFGFTGNGYSLGITGFGLALAVTGWAWGFLVHGEVFTQSATYSPQGHWMDWGEFFYPMMTAVLVCVAGVLIIVWGIEEPGLFLVVLGGLVVLAAADLAFLLSEKKHLC